MCDESDTEDVQLRYAVTEVVANLPTFALAAYIGFQAGSWFQGFAALGAISGAMSWANYIRKRFGAT
jgi:hypothetical protein